MYCHAYRHSGRRIDPLDTIVINEHRIFYKSPILTLYSLRFGVVSIGVFTVL